MRLRRAVIGVFVLLAVWRPAPASAQDAPSSSSAPARYVPGTPRTGPAPAAFLWIPLLLVAGGVYAVRVFIQPMSDGKRD